jgi:hypothetical protein
MLHVGLAVDPEPRVRGSTSSVADTQAMKRSPILYVSAIGLALWLGIVARQFALARQSPPADYAADMFWALSVFAALGLLFSSAPTWQLTAGAFILPASLKLAQLHHAPWADAIGGTHVGYLALGTDLVATDLACYALGAVAGMVAELLTLD